MRSQARPSGVVPQDGCPEIFGSAESCPCERPLSPLGRGKERCKDKGAAMAFMRTQSDR